MLLTGRIKKDGKSWIAECEAVAAYTCGNSRVDAVDMLADCVQTLVNHTHPGVTISATDSGDAGDGWIGVLLEASDFGALAATVLRQQRGRRGLSLADVAKQLGGASRNAYAQYERGQREPSIGKLRELLAVVAPELALTISGRAPHKPAATRKRA